MGIQQDEVVFVAPLNRSKAAGFPRECKMDANGSKPEKFQQNLSAVNKNTGGYTILNLVIPPTMLSTIASPITAQHRMQHIFFRADF
mmetsp:Transcript_32934/g.75334  ORF Transcript_32934/g.75334 Transcript_32934/m.75334 type:complete len:87 (+) Transcript_32934:107-367(+)